MPTATAAMDMASEDRSSARGDATDHLVLHRRQAGPTAKLAAVAPDQIGDLELRPLPGHDPGSTEHVCAVGAKNVQRTACFDQVVR